MSTNFSLFGPDDDEQGSPEHTPFSDLNGDGMAETQSTLIDPEFVVSGIDGDGIIDMQNDFLDTDGDGLIDTVLQGMDTDYDGIIDFEQVTSDVDGDGFVDMMTVTEYLDSDGDGIVDTISFAQDQNGDGYFDLAAVAQDLNADGLFEVITSYQNELFIWDNPPVYDPSQGMGNTFDPESAAPDAVVGDPEESMELWHLQETDSSCAVAAQEFVLEELLDREFTESELRDFAAEKGWYSESGTPMADVGNILEAFGLKVEKQTGGTVDDIADCLEKGGKVIVGVDADEIWYNTDNDIFGPGDDANHAVEVIGIDNSNPDAPMVILNDSGNPGGCGFLVPRDQFEDAWEDSGYFMVEAYK